MFHLLVITPEKKIFEDEVLSFITQGYLGYFEVLSHHAPFITPLKPGKLVITKKDKEKIIMEVSEGIVEVSNNQSAILADSVENIQPYNPIFEMKGPNGV